MQVVALKADLIQPLPVGHGEMMDRGTPLEGRPDKRGLLDPDLPAVPGEPDRTNRSPAEYSADLDRFIYNDCHVTSIVNICSPVKQIKKGVNISVLFHLFHIVTVYCNIFQSISLHFSNIKVVFSGVLIVIRLEYSSYGLHHPTRDRNDPEFHP